MRAPLGLLVLIALSACRGDAPREAGPAKRQGALAGPGEAGIYRFELKLLPEPPIVGEFFQVETRVLDARTGEPLSGADFTLDAAMPEHGHGMNAVPEHGERASGAYITEGMKFHMPGAWTLVARAEKDGRADRITLRYDQPPRAR